MGVSDPRFWNERYEKGEDGWELGRPAPPLVNLLRRDPPRRGRVAVPGCGRGHDVELFARLGYDATGFDFSPRAVEAARKAGRNVVLQDIFQLQGTFDLVWEYTCFCAIDPARRDEYLAVLARILRKGGELMALFYPLKEGTEGPPFPVSRDEIRRRLSKDFKITYMRIPRSSVEQRRGFEILVRARRTK